MIMERRAGSEQASPDAADPTPADPPEEIPLTSGALSAASALPSGYPAVPRPCYSVRHASGRGLLRAFGLAALWLGSWVPIVMAMASQAASPASVDRSLPDYFPREHVAGRVVGYTGMDTVERMMAAWNSGFRKFQPSADFSVVQKDGLAPEDRIALGPHVMEVFHPTDLAYENAYGYEPFRVKVCAAAYILKSHVSAIGVYVNRENPLASISLRKLDAIFSAERRRGYPADITTWGQLGLGGPWADRPIHVYGFYWRDDVTAAFRRLVMLDAPFGSTYDVPGGNMSRTTPEVAAAIMSALARDPDGIAFGNGSYMTQDVKALGLSVDSVLSQFTLDDIASGRYPLQRYLYIYVNRKPGLPLDPLMSEFLRFILSREGQSLVSKDGYLPLPPSIDAHELRKLD
jgi:phosphate transport system substrate-binding protein